MKQSFRNIGLAILSLAIAASCDKFLEENPDNRVELNSTEQAAQLLTNAYSNAAYTFTEWMGDNVVFTTGTTKLPEHNQSYQWEDVTSINQDTPGNFWTATYDAIAHANEVLAVIKTLPGEHDRKNAVEGEALLTRAYGHFMLVNLFAKDFDSQTAGDDPGIPYVKEPETVFLKQYERGTLEDVYEDIEEDLLDGLDLVDESFYANSGKYHFSRNAALAFASRFYLLKGDFDKCMRYSSQMLGADPDVFIKDIAGLLEESPTGENFIQQFTSAADGSNLLLIRNITNFPVTVGYWPSPNLIGFLYGDNENVGNPWGAEDIRTSLRYPIYLRGSGWGLGKYEFLFERTSLTSNVGLYYSIMPVFRGEEVLLNRAESYVYLEQVNNALADLQIYIAKRYTGNPPLTLATLRSYYQSTNDSQNVLSYIIEERRKEFMHEGLRWFDIKRYRFSVVHDTENGNLIELAPDDKRKILQIPQTAIDVGGLEPNPR
jgi:hypothetical protein